MNKNVIRLSKQFKPEHYAIAFTIAHDKKSFSGDVTIIGKKIGRPSKRLTLHQKELKCSHISVTHTDKKKTVHEVPISRTVSHDNYDELRIHTDTMLYPGEYEIKIHFSGKITKNMDGIYPCYFDDDGTQKELIATQFESHHAREAFPCIDEPESKATFQLTLTYPKHEVALSNTEPEVITIKDLQKTTIFKITPIMSTYLLAFVVGELHYKETYSSSGVRIRTYATKDQIAHSTFALDVASKCMDFYENYYDIPFPLEKCDFVALPDFASGAMENWGLITFREQTLLVDERHTSLSTKQYVAIVVAHELTHQWFGNLVTMRWWTDLWLNEGFASWMEYLAIDTLFPEWHLWIQFAVDEQQTALKVDSLAHTHPIEVPVKHPDEIRTIFDVISYQKGASVIHMLHDYLGPQPFRDGLRHYLKLHSYKNTDTTDLWQALEDITQKPVKKFMRAWTEQSGFPIIHVQAKNNYLQIEQSRFVTDPASKARHDQVLWPIPLLSEGLDRTIVDKKISKIPLTGKAAPLKLNVGQTGFYRVDYSHELQLAQLDQVEAGAFHSIDRMGLLSDSFETMKAGYKSVTEYLDLLQHFHNEDSLAVWEIIANSIGSIRATLSKGDADEELRSLMKPYIYSLIKKEFDRLGWKKQKDESHLDTLLRPTIIALAASTDDPQVLKTIDDLYNAKIKQNKSIDPDLRTTIYATAARRGDKKIFDQLLDIYKSSKSSDEKLTLSAALTSFEQPDIHSEVLKLIKSGTIRLQDISYWIAYSFMNRHARERTWKWLQENWQWLKENNGTDLSFSRMPLYVARTLSDEQQLQEYTEFFTKNMEPMLKRSYAQGIEIAETNVAWRNRDADAICVWLKNR